MQFDIIIPTKNSGQTISECLMGLYKSDVPINSIIVVDKFSKDGTSNIARQFGSRVIQENANYSQALRIGAKIAKTPYILILDSDVIIDPNFYAKLKPYIKSHFVTKGVFYHKMNWKKLSDWIFQFICKEIRSLEAAFVERERFLVLTGDWEDRRLDAGGDLVLFRICRQRGIPIIQLPQVVNIHLTGHFSRLWKQEKWYGRSDRKSNIHPKLFPVLSFLKSPFVGILLALQNGDLRFVPYQIMTRLCYLLGWLRG